MRTEIKIGFFMSLLILFTGIATAGYMIAYPLNPPAIYSGDNYVHLPNNINITVAPVQAINIPASAFYCDVKWNDNHWDELGGKYNDSMYENHEDSPNNPYENGDYEIEYLDGNTEEPKNDYETVAWLELYPKHFTSNDTAVVEIENAYVRQGGEWNNLWGFDLSIKWHLPGDFNLDGGKNKDDLNILLSNYGKMSGMRYENGDMDFDRDVDLADLAKWLSLN